VRTPLSWLRDFAAVEGTPAELTAALDDLGLVVEDVEVVGEGLGSVVVARVDEIAAIPGADRIRRVVVEAGDGPLQIVCGADNFAEDDLVPLAPVGAVLPGDFTIGRRTMKGVESNGMLCSGRELGLSEDGAGLLVLTDVDGARPGMPLTEALGLERDVVFDITVEGNRPDAYSMAGVARDLAARLHRTFTLPTPAPPAASGPAAGDLASLVVEDPDLCPRIVAAVLTGVVVGPSPRWVARRLTLAGMRPINNVVDASNYVMLELGQPTHPYDLDRLNGHGLRVRRAGSGEVLTTLDGNDRVLGVPGPGLGDTGEDCLICDAEGGPVGIAGIMGGADTEISADTTRVLLEAAYFAPMAIARTSKRLALRTEASARFERGCDPWGIDRAVARFCEILSFSSPVTVAPDPLEGRGDVPEPRRLEVPADRVNALLGTSLDPGQMAEVLEPLGFGCEGGGTGVLVVTVPTNRPDIRPAPHGVADMAEEVARGYGYARLERRQPAWPEVGGRPPDQRERDRLKDVACGLGADEAWTSSFLTEADHAAVGLTGPAVEVANPLVHEERFLRRSLLPGLLGALAHNADRRQGSIRLFEVGTVFSHPDEGLAPRYARAGADGDEEVALPGERQLLSMVLAADGDDAAQAVAALEVFAEAIGLTGVHLVAPGPDGPALPGLHPTRAAHVVAEPSGVTIGSVGEVDPDVGASFGLALDRVRRVGWVELDLGLAADRSVVARRSEVARPVSRYPSADIDLSLVVADELPADRVARVLAGAAGDLVESVRLVAVFRSPAVGEGRRSLTYRLRFCALDHTLTDAEVAGLRQACIDAAVAEVGAVLR